MSKVQWMLSPNKTGVLSLTSPRSSLSLESPPAKRQQTPVKSKPGDRIIRLNVGGTHFDTMLSTLTRCPDTYFSARFGQNWHDQGESSFIDRDGTYFRYILNYLRNGAVNERSDANILREILEEAQYYQISPLIQVLEQRIDQLHVEALAEATHQQAELAKARRLLLQQQAGGGGLSFVGRGNKRHREDEGETLQYSGNSVSSRSSNSSTGGSSRGGEDAAGESDWSPDVPFSMNEDF